MKKKLSPQQQTALKEHAKHHTPKHIKLMKQMMLKGASFTKSHKVVQKKEGM